MDHRKLKDSCNFWIKLCRVAIRDRSPLPTEVLELLDRTLTLPEPYYKQEFALTFPGVYLDIRRELLSYWAFHNIVRLVNPLPPVRKGKGKGRA